MQPHAPAVVRAVAPASPPPRPSTAKPTVAVVGLGYVGLPTGLALSAANHGVIGIDVSQQRLDAIGRGEVDLLPSDHERLTAALDNPAFDLTNDGAAVAEADVVMI